jgi:vacuolar iron transporter family protein
MRSRHPEDHRLERVGWLRAAVLGANDGIVSTASLIIGVAAASAAQQEIVVAGLAGLVAGAMSMAAGEYVSVSSQADAEAASLEKERTELREQPASEHAELKGIYMARGLDEGLADQVATQLMAKDALAVHARDELGISEHLAARPVQAALASAASFAVGAALPLATVMFASVGWEIWAVALASLVCLGLLGTIGAWTGGADPWRPTIRVLFWGALAMAITAGIGAIFGVVA